MAVVILISDDLKPLFYCS